ncbi:hypothetical protein ACFVFS_20560 [Kitasatospora sp. NPDC057692]|uniref:hypothetical protein n=1 Tax=Kitasatospora sp. NPDC057692 TaxID=3346215 RepID=UPI0036A353DA
MDAPVAAFERDRCRAAVVDRSAGGPHPVAGRVAGLRERQGARTLFRLGRLMRGRHDGPRPHLTGRRGMVPREG